jgi:hypothetical protein
MRHIIIPTLFALLAACSSGDKEPTQRQQIGQVWKYEVTKPGAKPTVAYIGSANSVQTLTAPDTFSVLLVQPMDNGEKEVTVKLVGAPFTCDLSACAVTAHADDGKAMTWHGRLTENKDGIAILPSQNAYDVIARAKTITIDLAVGAKDTAPFRFDVTGLNLKGE